MLLELASNVKALEIGDPFQVPFDQSLYNESASQIAETDRSVPWDRAAGRRSTPRRLPAIRPGCGTRWPCRYRGHSPGQGHFHRQADPGTPHERPLLRSSIE